MKMRRSSHKWLDSHEEGLLNLTPLIDVVFVVLIMFIIVVPMLEMDHVQLAKGGIHEKKELTAPQDASPITLHVRKDNTLLLNKHPVALPQLTAALKELKSRFPRCTPQVFHDQKAYFGTYQEIKNALEDAGFEEMDVILQPQ